jgi:hypothetical protein
MTVVVTGLVVVVAAFSVQTSAVRLGSKFKEDRR